jgi:hypothetical protein
VFMPAIYEAGRAIRSFQFLELGELHLDSCSRHPRRPVRRSTIELPVYELGHACLPTPNKEILISGLWSFYDSASVVQNRAV